MRAFQVFARMPREQAESFLAVLAEKAPVMHAQALAAAASAMKARPGFLLKQPAPRRADAVRRALSRVLANDAAEELLAGYFLDCRSELLVEWLDLVGLEHENGMLSGGEPVPPDPAKLTDAVSRFRAGEDPEERELLLRAFASQSAVEWPELDRLLEPASPAA